MKDNRREFIKKGGALAALTLSGVSAGKADLFGMKNNKETLSEISSKPVSTGIGMKIALQAPSEPTENNIRFIQQMGLKYVVLNTDATKSSYEYYSSRRKLYADAGILVYGFGNSAVHNVDAIVLGLPERDAKIEEYKRHIHNLGKAGIPYTTYAHMGNGIWSTEREKTRGGASTRGFDRDKSNRWRLGRQKVRRTSVAWS